MTDNIFPLIYRPVDEWEDVVSHPVADKRISIVPVFIEHASAEEGFRKLAVALNMGPDELTGHMHDAQIQPLPAAFLLLLL